MVDNRDYGLVGEQFRFDWIDERNDVRLPRLSNQRCWDGCCLGNGYLDTVYCGVGPDGTLSYSWQCCRNSFVGCSCINGRTFNRRLPRGDFIQRRNVVDSCDW